MGPISRPIGPYESHGRIRRDSCVRPPTICDELWPLCFSGDRSFRRCTPCRSEMGSVVIDDSFPQKSRRNRLADGEGSKTPRTGPNLDRYKFQLAAVTVGARIFWASLWEVESWTMPPIPLRRNYSLHGWIYILPYPVFKQHSSRPMNHLPINACSGCRKSSRATVQCHSQLGFFPFGGLRLTKSP
jgi:hypothetical protein